MDENLNEKEHLELNLDRNLDEEMMDYPEPPMPDPPISDQEQEIPSAKLEEFQLVTVQVEPPELRLFFFLHQIN